MSERMARTDDEHVANKARTSQEDQTMPATAYKRDPEIHSGAAVFDGTRVAVWVLFNWLAAGKSLDEFLAAHPQVNRESAVATLDDASRALVGQDSRGE
jgi:uncharacterized protein (DUF433 family)